MLRYLGFTLNIAAPSGNNKINFFLDYDHDYDYDYDHYDHFLNQRKIFFFGV